MKLMQLDRIPRKYHLLWDSAQKAIMIQIHRDCLHFVRVVTRDAPWVRHMEETFELDGLFDSFSGDLSSDSFGFNRAVRLIEGCGEYLRFLVAIPKIKILACYNCQECGGTGVSNEEYREGEKCLRCDSEGRQRLYDWRSAFAVTASLNLLFEVLEFPDETSAQESQSVTVQMIAQHGQHGSSMGGCFGTDLMEHICSNQPWVQSVVLKKVIDAMTEAHLQMFSPDGYHRGCIRADLHGNQICLTVPGDACGISTGFYRRPVGGGSEFSCHNVDNPLQSLALLAGIASLTGQVDSAISASKGKVAA